MADLSTDLFKFVALRSPADALPTEFAVRFLRDPRIEFVEHYPLPDITKDAAEFSASPAGALVRSRVQAALATLGAAADIPAANRQIATTFALEPLTWPAPSDVRITALVGAVAGVTFTDLDAVVAAITAALAGTGTPVDDYLAAPAGGGPAPVVADLHAAFDSLYRTYVAKQVRPVNLESWFTGLRVVSAVYGVLAGRAAGAPPAGVVPITTLETFDAVRRATPVVHPMFTLLVGYYRPFNTVSPIGIGDLLVVKQFLRRYEPGEIAHVENVLRSELKSRTHRILDRSEDVLVSETESVQETTRELSSTERFELKSETESTIQRDLNVEISGQVSGRYGVVEVSASSGVTYNQSSQDSRRSSNNFAKDVIDRSLTRIQTRVREERTTRRTHEVEETNVHQLDNRAGTDGNVTGVYRWLDKRYTAQVYNYGKRLMFEFVVPEPAAFVLQAFDRSKNLDAPPDIPQPPARPDLVISAISQQTLDAYAKIFPLGTVRPEPKKSTRVTKSVQASGIGQEGATAHEKQFDVPDGYLVSTAEVTGAFEGVNIVAQGHDWGVFVSLGGITVDHQTQTTEPNFHQRIPKKTMTFAPPLSGSPTVSVLAYRVISFEVNIALTLVRSEEALRGWQIEVYKAIMDAYGRALTEYRSELTEYRDRLDAHRVGRGVVIHGRNERINQDVIRTELKKGCLAMIALQFDTDRSDDITFDAMKTRDEQIEETSVVRTETTTASTTVTGATSVTVTTTKLSDQVTTTPTPIKIASIDVADAIAEGQVVQFLEQAFEWQQMTYVLYPYFWGKLPDKWFDAQRYYDEADPLFARFLQAGSARVLLAARPGFELAVLHYLRTRQPWNGGPPPGIDSALYLAVHEELRDQQDDLNGAAPYGDPWEVVVPTSLVWLQADAELPVFDGGTPGRDEASGLWTGSVHQATLSTLSTDQTAWTSWPDAATWQVRVPRWATEVDVNVTLNPGVCDGPVWGELRLQLGDSTTEAAMFDVNYVSDLGGWPEQAVMLIGDTLSVPPAMRGKTVRMQVQGRMLDPANHPGRLEANRGCHVNGQLNFKAAPDVGRDGR